MSYSARFKNKYGDPQPQHLFFDPPHYDSQLQQFMYWHFTLLHRLKNVIFFCQVRRKTLLAEADKFGFMEGRVQSSGDTVQTLQSS
ncbi:hypothetical protein Tco_0907499 [Tanacetum coccineum]|uniref:Uncharacterized protein n=1 Tax=Tanacetum coccineum TaxID=301880 RepID=A0ABQ5CQS8_9ASTR